MYQQSKLYSLIIHTKDHSQDDLILNRDLFGDIQVGDYIRVTDPDRPDDGLVLVVPSVQIQNRIEISLSKVVAEPLNFKPFSRVQVERVNAAEVEVNSTVLSIRITL